MRILLTLPPGIHTLEIYRIAGMKVPPLGLAWIAAVLEREGHKVSIIDSPTLELDVEKWIRLVKGFRPDIVGFSLLTPTAPKGYRAVKLVKEELPGVITVAGGQHPTAMFSEALNEGFDVVVLREGEYTMRDLVRVIESRGFDPAALMGVDGIAFRDPRSGAIRVTRPRRPIEKLDELPWPARHLLPMDKYTLLGKPIRVAHVMASRGCPYGCMYCSTSYFWGRRVRFRSPRDVADEVEFLYEKYGARYVVFADDELTINKYFVRRWIEEIRERGLDIRFACGSRVNHVNREILDLMIRSGCVMLYFGVESASQETLDRIGKRITPEQAEKVFSTVRELGGHAMGSFILGFPWESLDDMKATVEFAVKLDPDYAQFTALTPYPGTPLYTYAKKHGLIEDWNWEHYTTIQPVMRGFKWSRRDLARMIKYAYRRFFLRPRFILREALEGRLWSTSRVVVKEVVNVLRDKLLELIKHS
ncbi:MAG: B12-binding domain-containing radical SAM protein [Hyperthermus sp.]|nr:MAG: B12-binding domain-containing radical SAM protein [Hyperthermus sp.]